MKKTLKTSTAVVAAGAVAGLLVACGDPQIEGDKDPTDPATQGPNAEDSMKEMEEEMKKAQEAGAGDGGNEDDGGDGGDNTPPDDGGDATPSP